MSRKYKVAEALKRELSNIIHGELRDPRIGFTTVTCVELSPDLRFAKIYFSVLGNDQEKEKTFCALKGATAYIRRLIAERLNLRFAPEIVFKEDDSSEYSIRLQQEFEKIKASGEHKKSNRTDK